jgi:hypothetical protein
MIRIVKFFVVTLVFASIVFAGFTPAVQHLWNWLMPTLFGLHMITYWQGQRWPLASSHARAVGTDDSGRAGKIPLRYAPRLWFVSRSKIQERGVLGC